MSFRLSQILVLLFLVISPTVFAQTRLNNIQEIDLLIMPHQDNAKLLAESRSLANKNRPLEFATPINASIEPSKNGTWESISNGQMRWRMRIASPTAHSINLAFDKFHLPKSAKLYIYDRLQQHVIGPISAHDNDDHQEWWSPIIPFDEVILELIVNPSEVSQIVLHLDKVNHDFTAIGSALSGSCNLDVLCGSEDGFELVDEYRDIINSVGMYTLNGIRQCSGVLVNNVREDCTPYFLTANHCEINNNNAASVVVYWNFQNSFCRAPNSNESGGAGDGRLTDFTSGSRLLAKYNPSDFALLLLDDDPSEFEPFFAGWDAETELFDTTISIHHPNSDEKRISFDFQAPTFLAENFWVRVEDWDIGTTESGSSGAPIFSKEKRVIGQLNGGEASCGNSGFDDFGAFKLSWTGGGTKSTSLKDWLDPDNTGITIMDGRACSNILSVVESANRNLCLLTSRRDTTEVWIKSGFEKGANLTTENVPSGVTIGFEKQKLLPGEVSKVYIEVSPQFSGNNATFLILATDGLVTSDVSLSYQFYNSIPVAPQLVSPKNGGIDVGLETALIWESTEKEFIIELSKNSDFQIIENQYAQLNSTTLNIGGLDANNNYYWRVKAINRCGLSEYSTIFSFTVGDVKCNSQEAKDLPKVIGNEAVTVSSTINITSEGNVVDVNVLNIQGKHSWISDLTFRLTSPSGTSVDLAINPCDDENDFFISFDDESENINLPCPLRSIETYRPLRALSKFDGESVKGNWRLDVIDDASLDGGSFDGWTLELCTIDQLSQNINTNTATIKRCDDLIIEQTITGNVGGGFLSDVTLHLTDENGDSVNAIINPNPVPANTGFIITLNQTVLPSVSKINLIASAAEMPDSNYVVFTIENIGVPSLPEIINPIDQATNVNPDKVELQWSVDPSIISTRLTLSSMADFSDVLLDTIVEIDIIELSIPFEELTTYFWKITQIGECEERESATYSFTTDMKVSIDDPAIRDLSIYPNPVSTSLYLDWKSDELLDFVLYNQQGQSVKSQRLKRGISTIDVISLPAGIYIYSINGIQSQTRGKVFISN